MSIIHLLYHHRRTFSSKGHWLWSCKMHWDDKKCVQNSGRAKNIADLVVDVIIILK